MFSSDNSLVTADSAASMSPHVALFGAAPDTGNMGVSALFHSTVSGLCEAIPGISITVFDNGLGRRSEKIRVGEEEEIEIIRRGARAGRRYERPQNLATMSLMSALGTIGATVNSNLRAIDTCDAVLDLSGGDSFTDMYGRKRFFSVLRPKQISLNRRIPLILLPQTYGPFTDPRLRTQAASVVRGADMCWARDQRSFAVLRDLLGDNFDPLRHRCGVDMAFGLPPREPLERLSTELRALLATDRVSTPLIGFNVSGLIYNAPDESRSRYRFKADYPELVDRFLRWLLQTTGANLLLVPHVMCPAGSYESDSAACDQVARRLGPEFDGRVFVSPWTLDQCQVKWLISQTDWFCGTRMHSTIAALSSAVPTATVSYSDKAIGVFETCGQAEHVIDPRQLDTAQVVERLKRSFADREHAKLSLVRFLPDVKHVVNEQLTAIAARIQASVTNRNRRRR